jgi:hypothetical protein
MVVGKSVPAIALPKIVDAVESLIKSAQVASTSTEAESEDASDLEGSDCVYGPCVDEAQAIRLRCYAAQLLKSARVHGKYRVSSQKCYDGSAVGEPSVYDVVLTPDSSSCTCWHFTGKHIICCHIFAVAQQCLRNVGECPWFRLRIKSSVECSVFHCLLGAVIAEIVGKQTEWFIRREPLVPPS